MDGAEASTAGDLLSHVVLLDLRFFVKCSANPQGTKDFIYTDVCYLQVCML